MLCTNCKIPFVQKRSTAKFCSDKCRVYASRGKPTPGSRGRVVKTVNEILTRVSEPCKHNVDPKYCKFARPGKPCK